MSISLKSAIYCNISRQTRPEKRAELWCRIRKSVNDWNRFTVSPELRVVAYNFKPLSICIRFEPSQGIPPNYAKPPSVEETRLQTRWTSFRCVLL